MPSHGRASYILNAMQILEIGTGAGDVTLLLAQSLLRQGYPGQALAPGGLLLTMEADPRKAARARRRFADAGCGGRISVIVGEAARFLHKVRGPFDVIVVNVPGVPQEPLTRLRAPGGVVVANHATIMVNDMTIAEWLALAKADADKRGLPELIPMLDGLAQATERLRAADWNDSADKDTPFDSAQGKHENDDDQ